MTIHIVHQAINGRANPNAKVAHAAVTRCGLKLQSWNPFTPGRTVVVGAGPGVQHQLCPKCAPQAATNGDSFIDPTKFQDERGVPLPPVVDSSMGVLREEGHFDVRKTEQQGIEVRRNEDDCGWGPAKEGNYESGQV